VGDSALHVGCLGKASLEIQAFFDVDFWTPEFENASPQTRSVRHLSTVGMDIGAWLQCFPNWEFHTSCAIQHHQSHLPPALGALGVQAANRSLQAGSWQYGAGKEVELQGALKVSALDMERREIISKEIT